LEGLLASHLEGDIEALKSGDVKLARKDMRLLLWRALYHLADCSRQIAKYEADGNEHALKLYKEDRAETLNVAAQYVSDIELIDKQLQKS
jgi:hypothetical protein